MLKRKLCSIAGQIVLILVTILMLSPIVYMVLNSLKPYSQMLKEPWALPETLFLDNYIKAFNQMEFFQSLFNSVFITGASVAIIVILGAFSCLSDCKIPESADRIFGNLFSCRVYGADTGVDRTDIFYYEELQSYQYAFGNDNSICGKRFVCDLYVSGIYPVSSDRYGGIRTDGWSPAVAVILEGSLSAFKTGYRNTGYFPNNVDLE